MDVGRTDLTGELGFVPAPRETDPTPVLTRPGVGPASTMVTRWRAREGRDVNTVPETEFRPEMVTPAETCEGGLGAARPFAIDTTDQYITADTPEVVIGQGITTSQEVNTSFPHTNTQTAPSHIDFCSGIIGSKRIGRTDGQTAQNARAFYREPRRTV